MISCGKSSEEIEKEFQRKLDSSNNAHIKANSELQEKIVAEKLEEKQTEIKEKEVLQQKLEILDPIEAEVKNLHKYLVYQGTDYSNWGNQLAMNVKIKNIAQYHNYKNIKIELTLLDANGRTLGEYTGIYDDVIEKGDYEKILVKTDVFSNIKSINCKIISATATK